MLKVRDTEDSYMAVLQAEGSLGSLRVEIFPVYNSVSLWLEKVKDFEAAGGKMECQSSLPQGLTMANLMRGSFDHYRRPKMPSSRACLAHLF